MSFGAQQTLSVRSNSKLVAPAAPPPPGIIPVEASDDVLRMYGFPPRPNKETCPRRYANWERLMSRPLTFVAPEYASASREDTSDPPIDPSILSPPATIRRQHEKWSGAVNYLLKCGDIFQHIEASWNVPGAYPHPNKYKTPTTWDASPSKYRSAIWVGIDGSQTSHDVLQAGTALRCDVNKEDGTLKQETVAWFEWYPEDPVYLTKFKVQPGDVITVMIYFDGVASLDGNCPAGGGRADGHSGDDGGVGQGGDDGDRQKKQPTLEGHAIFVNESNSTYTSFTYNYTAPKTYYEFRGSTAEWILEGHHHVAVPNFGATFLYNCLATTAMNEERDLDYAVLLDMVRNGRHVVTPVKVTSNILGLYWGQGQSTAHKVEGI